MWPHCGICARQLPIGRRVAVLTKRLLVLCVVTQAPANAQGPVPTETTALATTAPATTAPATTAPATTAPTATRGERAQAPAPPSAVTPAVPAATTPAQPNVSPNESVRWLSPDDCPAPRQRLDELLNAPSKQPLWGSIEVTKHATGWSAQLRLSDAPGDASPASATERVLDGQSCEEVSEAALLVVSIMQRELREREAALTSSNAATEMNAELGLAPAPAPVPTPTPAPLVPKPPTAPTPASPPTPSQPSAANATTVRLGAAGSLWNLRSLAFGATAELEHTWGRFAVRPQLGLTTTVNPIQTSASVEVGVTSYDASLQLCFNMVEGVNLCAGPSLQRITVSGDEIGQPTQSSAWFPGAGVALVGTQERAGIGVWGAIGANFRFKEIALDVDPLGEVARVKRASVYAWAGPQWRWR